MLFFGVPAVCEMLEICVPGTGDVVVNHVWSSGRHTSGVASALVWARLLPD